MSIEHMPECLRTDWVSDDAGMARIKNPHHVKQLILSGSRVTNAGLKHLRCMMGLEYLELRFSQLTDEGLKNLKRLDLQRTSVGNDGGLKHLSGLTKLVNLNLSRTRVTDAGLKHLEGLKNLRVLYADDTRIIDSRTDRPCAGAVALMRVLPDLQVKRKMTCPPSCPRPAARYASRTFDRGREGQSAK